MWKALVHIRRAKELAESQDYCILDAGDPGGYINAEADLPSKAAFEEFVRNYLVDYGVDVVEFLEVEKVGSSDFKEGDEVDIRLGTLHTYGADDA